MPLEQLDPAPGSEEKPPAGPPLSKVLSKSTKRPQQKDVEPVSFEQYRSLLEDHPEKFSEAQVLYRKATDIGQECSKCLHMYKQIAGRGRNVCEILRPVDEERGIDPESVCQFFTRNGTEYPYMKQQVPSNKPTTSGEEGST